MTTDHTELFKLIKQLREGTHLQVLAALEQLRANNWLDDDLLYEADLQGAKLHSTQLSDVDFRWANLTEADLHASNLSTAGLYEATLTRANLCRANLQKTHLVGADLVCADLRVARLDHTDLREASLCGANLTGAQYIETAYCNEGTILPDGSAWHTPMDWTPFVEGTWMPQNKAIQAYWHSKRWLKQE